MDGRDKSRVLTSTKTYLRRQSPHLHRSKATAIRFHQGDMLIGETANLVRTPGSSGSALAPSSSLRAESLSNRRSHGPTIFLRTNVHVTFSDWKKRALIGPTFQSGLASPSVSFMFFFLPTNLRISRGPTIPHSAKPLLPPTAHTRRPMRLSDHTSCGAGHHHTLQLPVLTTTNSPTTTGPNVSREADPAHDSECQSWKASFRLWLRPRCARLAVWLRILPRDLRRRSAGGAAQRDLLLGRHHRMPNLEIVETLLLLLDEFAQAILVVPHKNLVTFIKDRPCQDRRYAMDTQNARELRIGHPAGSNKPSNWNPQDRSAGILEHEDWVPA